MASLCLVRPPSSRTAGRRPVSLPGMGISFSLQRQRVLALCFPLCLSWLSQVMTSAVLTAPGFLPPSYRDLSLPPTLWILPPKTHFTSALDLCHALRPSVLKTELTFRPCRCALLPPSPSQWWQGLSVCVLSGSFCLSHTHTVSRNILWAQLYNEVRSHWSVFPCAVFLLWALITSCLAAFTSDFYCLIVECYLKTSDHVPFLFKHLQGLITPLSLQLWIYSCNNQKVWCWPERHVHRWVEQRKRNQK